jgi:hypothetical protein
MELQALWREIDKLAFLIFLCTSSETPNRANRSIRGVADGPNHAAAPSLFFQFSDTLVNGRKESDGGSSSFQSEKFIGKILIIIPSKNSEIVK